MDFRSKIRPYLLTIAFSAIGSLVVYILKYILQINLTKLEMSIISFIVTSVLVLYLFPKVFKIPFGKASISDFIRKVGLYKPINIHKFIIIGIIAAAFTLTGMLVGSLLTDKFVLSFSTVTLSHAVFSLTPGIWEEVLFRGVLMILLIRATQSFKNAAIIQLVIFGLVHIKGFNFLSLVDAFSVMILAIAFTYLAYKTRSLIPGIVFHYLHDTFLFFVQLPDGVYEGFKDNALFYASLWSGVALSIIVIKRISERFNICGDFDFYNIGNQNQSDDPRKTDEDINKRKEQNTKKILIINAIGFLAILILGFDESSLFVNIFIALFVITNLVLFFLWKKITKTIYFKINLLTALVALITAYDYYSKNSHYVYLIWLLIGFVNIIIAFVRKGKEKI